jgi:hypothetical protein
VPHSVYSQPRSTPDRSFAMSAATTTPAAIIETASTTTGSDHVVASKRDYSDRYDPDTHIDRIYTDETGRAIAEWMRAGDQVLELGCATGRMSRWFADAGANVVGVDRSAVYLDRARSRGLTGAHLPMTAASIMWLPPMCCTRSTTRLPSLNAALRTWPRAARSMCRCRIHRQYIDSSVWRPAPSHRSKKCRRKVRRCIPWSCTTAKT